MPELPQRLFSGASTISSWLTSQAEGSLAGQQPEAVRISSGRRRWRDVFDEQRYVRLDMAVHGKINRVETRLVKLELLDVDRKIARPKMNVLGQGHLDGHLDRGHDGVAIGVHEVQFHLPLAFVTGKKSQPQRDRALRMNGGQFARVDRVERAKQVELAIVIGDGVAKHCNLNVHARDR